MAASQLAYVGMKKLRHCRPMYQRGWRQTEPVAAESCQDVSPLERINTASTPDPDRVCAQNILCHCFRNYTGYASRSAFSSGCVFWHITVCMAQHQRIWQTACGRHQRSSLVVVFVLTTLLVPSTLGVRAFPVAAAREWNSLPAQTRTASSLMTFRRHTKAYLFRQSFGWWNSITVLPAGGELNLNTCFGFNL